MFRAHSGENGGVREGTPRAAAHESDKTDRATAPPRTVLNDERNMRTGLRKHEQNKRKRKKLSTGETGEKR